MPSSAGPAEGGGEGGPRAGADELGRSRAHAYPERFVLTARIEITDLLIFDERRLRGTLAGYADGAGRAEDAGHQGTCARIAAGRGWSSRR